jgi:hypothetical protein
MGVTLTYLAIPPQSSFYARLQHDRAFRVLAQQLFPHESLFGSFEYDPVTFNKCMGEAIDSHPDIFCGTELETSMLVGEFRDALRITCRDYPKIVGITSASLEKSFTQIRDRLTEELSRRKFEDVDDIVATLLYGDIDLGKSVNPDEESFGFALTSREAVRKGASILRQIEPETLFPEGDDGNEGWYSMNFTEWKEFYLLVDKLDAEIIMDVI